MKIRLVLMPYHLGQEGVASGGGPDYYIQQGLEQYLTQRGHTIDSERISQDKFIQDETSRIFSVNQNLAKTVTKTLNESRFPLVLAGNCNSCLGTLAATGTQDIGVIWFDAHGDFNTPEITITGYFDGMPLAIATGHCYQKEWLSMGVKSFVPESNVLLAGLRDPDPKEKTALDQSAIQMVSIHHIKGVGIETALGAHLDALRKKVAKVYLHIDVDSIDRDEAPGVNLPGKPGLSTNELKKAIEMIAKRFVITAAAFTVFNPEKERENKTVQTVFKLIEVLASQLWT